MKTTDLLIYAGLFMAGIVPGLWSWLTPKTSPLVRTDDWRQPWVADLMDLQMELETAGNATASETCRMLIMEIVSNGSVVKQAKVKP